MAFDLPNLDNKTYAELRNQLVKLIPQYTQKWTDFNASDPGITLLELLCWVNETLLYQANQVPLGTYINFLRWLAGASGSQEIQYRLQQIAAAADSPDLAYLNLLTDLQQIETDQSLQLDYHDLQKKALTFLQAPYLAITAQDFVELAGQTARVIQAGKPGILHAVVQTWQKTITLYVVCDQLPQYTIQPFPITMPDQPWLSRQIVRRIGDSGPDPYLELLPQVQKYLQPRLLLGTVLTVKAAVLTEVDIDLALNCAANVQPSVIVQQLMELILQYLNIVTGGHGQKGWQYDQAPNLLELEHVVYSVPEWHA